MAAAIEIHDNRFEHWLARRRANGLILLVLLGLLWLALDSLVAVALVLAGLAPAADFHVTRPFAPARPLDPVAQQMVALRGAGSGGYMDRFEADGLLGQRLVPGFLTTTPPDWGGWVQPSFWFMTNDQGFPPVEPGPAALLTYVVPKPAGVFRIAVLGGSTVEGNGVNTPMDSLPAKLRQTLQAAFKRTPHPGYSAFEVINAGVSNYASDQEYLHLLADILPYQPDLVLVYDGWNDAEVLPSALVGNAATRYYRPQSQADDAARVKASFTIGGSLSNAAALAAPSALDFLDGFATFRGLHDGFTRLGHALHAGAAAPAASFDPAGSIAAAALFEQNRLRMLFLAQQQGFRFASFLQPVMTVDGKPYTPAEQDIRSKMTPIQAAERSAFYEAVRPRIASLEASRSAPGQTCFSDLSTTSFAQHPEQVYADSGHLNATGNAIVASGIADTLETCGVLWPAQ
jgi:lysophospholipase L1-like esterase